jgi:hemoglobin
MTVRLRPEGRPPPTKAATTAASTRYRIVVFMIECRVDIQTQADIRTLVDRFYEKVNRDALLAPIFNEVAGVDWPSHLATLYSFWETMLFGTGTYQGAPFPKHSVLPVEKAHFDRWLKLFLETVDENFSGPKAEEAKGRALSIADTFARRMGVLPPRTVLLQP